MKGYTMNEKITLLANLLNESLSMVGLPEMSHKKTQVFVKMNNMLKKFTTEQLVLLADDYGLLLPALVLSDINVDYAKLLQNKNQVDVNGFIIYTDIVFLRMSENNKNIMLHITNYDSKLPPKEIRRLFIQDTLETFINTREIPADEIVQSLVSKYQQ